MKAYKGHVSFYLIRHFVQLMRIFLLIKWQKIDMFDIELTSHHFTKNSLRLCLAVFFEEPASSFGSGSSTHFQVRIFLIFPGKGGH